MCLNIGTTNYHHFPFGTNGKVVVLGVPILKHFRVNTGMLLSYILNLMILIIGTPQTFLVIILNIETPQAVPRYVIILNIETTYQVLQLF